MYVFSSRNIKKHRENDAKRISFEVAVVSSTTGITRIRATLFINYIHVAKNAGIYSVFYLVVPQRICIFPAETLLMLMMLHQTSPLSLYPVSMFKALFSGSISGHF